MLAHFSQGIGAYMLYGGLVLDEMMFDFHRQEDHLQIRRLTDQFQAPGDKALQNAIDLTFGPSIVASLPIESEKDKGKTILIQVNDYFLSDVSGLSELMNLVFRQPVRMDGKKAYFNNNLHINYTNRSVSIQLSMNLRLRTGLVVFQTSKVPIGYSRRIESNSRQI